MAKARARTMTDNTRFAEATERLNELVIERNQLQQKTVDLSAEIGNLPPVDDITSEAEAMTTGGTAVDVVSPVALRKELSDTYRRLEVLERAIKKQGQLVDIARFQAEREVAEDLLAEHKAIAKRADNALAAFQEAMAEDTAFRQRLQAATGSSQYPAPLKPIVLHGLSSKAHGVGTGRIDQWRADLGDYLAD